MISAHLGSSRRPGRPSAGRDRTGAWRGGFLLSAIEVAIKEDLRRHLRTIQRLRLMSDLTGFDLTQMWLQEQDGSVTLSPAVQLGDRDGARLPEIARDDPRRPEIR